MKYTIYWLRKDLRVQDNLCIEKAIELGYPVLFLYIYHFDDKQFFQKPFDLSDENRIGGASKWWLHHSLKDFANNLKAKFNSDLTIKIGSINDVFQEFIKNKNFEIENIIHSEQYGIYSIQKEKNLELLCAENDINLFKINNSCLIDLKNFHRKDGSYYKVYTPFWKNIFNENLDLIRQNSNYDYQKLIPFNVKKSDIDSSQIEDLNLLPKRPNWAINFQWEIGENAANKKFETFLSSSILTYKKNRDFPAIDGVSGLSPHLAFGEISPWKIFNSAHELYQNLSDESEKKSVFCFMSEVVWREFSYYLLYHFPKLPYQNFNSKFDNFSWENNREFLTSWEAGSTGFPIIDAAMEQLWNTGWMHNRLRMVVGSFLIKNLLVDWRLGERYFFNTLVDYDLASNSFGWQWVAGSGADASPYFRIFNPILQSQKFDTNCIFIKKYLPVVQNVENAFIHDPFLQSNHKQVDLFTKRNYYKPIVDLSKSRNKALEIYKSMK